MMRKIAANIIYTVASEPIKNGYLVVEADGTIVKVVDTNNEIREISGLEYYSGILIPGMVLKLSGKSNTIFLNSTKLDYTSEQKKWIRYLFSRGVQAVSCDKIFNSLAQTQTFVDYLYKLSQVGETFQESLMQLTIDNAANLDIEDTLGTFEPGKQPGVLLLSGFDYENETLGLNASIKRLV